MCLKTAERATNCADPIIRRFMLHLIRVYNLCFGLSVRKLGVTMVHRLANGQVNFILNGFISSSLQQLPTWQTLTHSGRCASFARNLSHQNVNKWNSDRLSKLVCVHNITALRGTCNHDSVLSQWAHNVKMTSYQRRCDVITSHRRWYDVILMLCACWDSCSHTKFTKSELRYNPERLFGCTECTERTDAQTLLLSLIFACFGLAMSSITVLTQIFGETCLSKLYRLRSGSILFATEPAVLDMSKGSQYTCQGPEVIKPFSCSTQLSMKFVLLIYLKLLTIANSFLLT